MVRIAGVDLPKNKRIEIGLTYIYGVGRNNSQYILEKVQINSGAKVQDLGEEEILKLREYLENQFQVEGDLRKLQTLNIKRLIDINCYRGRRHRSMLPVRGQRTKTNARTNRGTKKTVAGKKKVR
uniref:Ribosomal protein S13 n=1 Tax=Gronococcus sybilensis TaxID=3028029 RepID=A0A9Y1MXA7_9RHOD|nr:ribosomal protein S13 [Gronococcus sybilensis]